MITELDLIIILFIQTALILDRTTLLNTKKQICHMKLIVDEWIQIWEHYISKIEENTASKN